MKKILLIALFAFGCNNVASIQQVEYFEPDCAEVTSKQLLADNPTLTSDTLTPFEFSRRDEPIKWNTLERDSTESFLFTVRGRLSQIQGRDFEGMLWFQVEGEGSSGLTGNILNPACTGASPYLAEITAVHDSVTAWYGPFEKNKVLLPDDSVEITGVAIMYRANPPVLHHWRMIPVLSIKRF